MRLIERTIRQPPVSWGPCDKASPAFEKSVSLPWPKSRLLNSSFARSQNTWRSGQWPELPRRRPRSQRHMALAGPAAKICKESRNHGPKDSANTQLLNKACFHASEAREIGKVGITRVAFRTNRQANEQLSPDRDGEPSEPSGPGARLFRQPPDIESVAPIRSAGSTTKCESSV